MRAMVRPCTNAVVSFSKRQLQFDFWAFISLVAILFTFSLVAANSKPDELPRD
jgi:hypothetical protein